MFTLKGHADAVCCLAYSPDGKMLASGDQGGGFTLWELASRSDRHSFYLRGAYGHLFAERMTSISYSPDGKCLVTTTHTYPPFVRVWAADDMTLLREWEGGFSANHAVFLPDGRTVVSVGSGGVGDHEDCPLYLWDLERTDGLPKGPVEDIELRGESRTPQPRNRIAPGHERNIVALGVSPTGLVVTGSADCTARLWDFAKREELARRSFRGEVRAVAVSPDGQLAALASGKSVFLWDIARPRSRPRKLTGHTKKVRAVAFHPHGRLLGSGGDDGIVRLWDVSSGSSLQAFDWNLGWVGALAFAPDGDTAAAGGGSWDIVVFDLDLS